MFLVKLVQEAGGALYRPGDKLGIEHHVQRVNAEMPLRALPPEVHLDRVAHGLEGVK